MKTAEDYIDEQCRLSRAGATAEEVEHLVCIAHYLIREEGGLYSPAMAAAGEHYYQQMKNPN